MAATELEFAILASAENAVTEFGHMDSAGHTAIRSLSSGFSNMSNMVGGEVGDLLNRMSAGLDSLGESSGHMGEKMAIGGAAIAGVGSALSLLGSKERAAQNELQAAIGHTGGTWSEYQGRVDAVIHTQEGFNHTSADTQSALATLVQQTGNTSEALNHMQLVANLAAAQHMSLESAATDVGRILNGNTRTLKEYGLSLTNATQAAAALTKAEKELSTAQKAQQTDTAGLQSAQDSLTRAEAGAQQAAQALTQAQDNVTSAQQRVGQAVQNVGYIEQQVAQANATAVENVRSAEQRLDAAQAAETTVQQGLTAAREAAAQSLLDMSNKLADAQLATRSAQIAVEQAQQNLDVAMNSGTASDIDKQSAQLALDQAVQHLHEQQQATQTLAAEKKKADKAGVDGSTQVVAAEHKIEQAHQAVRTAAQGVGRAEQARAATAERGSHSIAAAMLAEQTARQSLVRSQASEATAAEHVSLANLTLQRAQEKVGAEQAKLAADSANLVKAHHDVKAAQEEVTKAQQAGLEAAAELEQRVGGSALASVDTYAGHIQHLVTVMEDWAAQMGNKFGVAIQVAGGAFSIAGTAAQIYAAWQTRAAASTIATTAATDTQAASAAADAAALDAQAASVTAASAALDVQAASTDTAAAAQDGLNVAMDANPIGLVVLAIAGLIAVLVLAWEHSKTFRDIVTGAFHDVENVVSGVWHWIGDHWKLLLEILTGPIGLATGWILDHWHEISDGAKTAVDWIKNHFDDLVNALGNTMHRVSVILQNIFIGLWNGIKWVINDIVTAWNSTIGGLSVDLSWMGLGTVGIPKLGTVAYTPSVPMSTSRPAAAGSATSSHRGASTVHHTTVNIHGVTDKQGAAREIHQVLTNYKRTSMGGAGLGLG